MNRRRGKHKQQRKNVQSESDNKEQENSRRYDRHNRNNLTRHTQEASTSEKKGSPDSRGGEVKIFPRDVTSLPTEAAVERKRRRLPSYCKLILMPMFAAMSKITDNLYLTSIGGMTQENFEKYKITCVINATFEAPNLRKKGIESIRVPVDDSPVDDIQEYFDQIADKINERTLQGINIVVHCVAGVSRSTSLVLAYLMKYHKMDLHAAFSYTHSKRPVVRPNNGFFKQLLNYEIKLFGKNSFKIIQMNVNGVAIEAPDFFQTEHKGFILLESLKEKSKMEAKNKRRGEQTVSEPEMRSDVSQASRIRTTDQANVVDAERAAANEDYRKESLLKSYVIQSQNEVPGSGMPGQTSQTSDMPEEKTINQERKSKKDRHK